MTQLVHVLVVQRGLVGVEVRDRAVAGGGGGRERVQGGILRRPVAPGRRGALFRRQLSLRRVALEVRGQPKPQGVLDVQAFNALEVPDDLGHALAEAHAVVVHRVFVGVVGEGV